MNAKPTVEERVWAVLAHLSALAMGMGLPLPIVGWSENRRKSKYTSFQCLQALGYQSLGYTIWVLTALVVLVIFSVGTLAGILNVENPETAAFAFVTSHFTLILALMAIYYFLPVWGAVACALGRDFRYPFMGNRLSKYLGYELAGSSEEEAWLVEEHEDRWVASMGHFAVIIVFWGILAPIFAWAMQGKRSAFLKFQSVQTVVYQVLTMLLYIAGGFFYLFGLGAFVVLIGFEGLVALDSSSGVMGVVVILVALLIAMLIILAVPLLHILGQWAGYRVLKGDEYRYPIVGRLVERWVSNYGKSSKKE